MADDGGLARFRRRMQAIPAAVREAVKPALTKGAEEIASVARTLAPEDTGDLIQSIVATGPGELTPRYSTPTGAKRIPENAAAVTVGNQDVRYGHLVEYGTTKTTARPFFWPAVRSVRKRAANRVSAEMRKAVREAGK